MLVVLGLNKLASAAGFNRTDFRKRKDTDVDSNNGNETKSSTCSNAPFKAKISILQNVLMLALFVLTGLFCWKVVVRNRVWTNRETLFR